MDLDVFDPDQRRIIETARAWGVPVSTFMGEPTETRTYSLNGTLIGTTITPGWGESDRQHAIELALYEESVCSGCGQSMHETCDPANEGKYQAQSAIRCHRCTASAVAMEQYEKSPHPSALRVPMVLRGTDHEADLPSGG